MSEGWKLWVDDIRNAPNDGWVVARTITAAIRLLDRYDFAEISLDHDISHQVYMAELSRPYPCTEDFSAVAYYVARKYQGCSLYPKIIVHSSNPVGAQKIKDIFDDWQVPCEIRSIGKPANRLEMEVS